MEKLNNRLEKAINEALSLTDATEESKNGLKMQYEMLFGWWLLDGGNEYDKEKIDNLLNAEYVDFFDFVSPTVIAICQINKGKREFDFDNVKNYNDKEMRKWYYNVDGVAIQKHNKVLGEYSLDLIDYMYACVDEVNGVLMLSRYKEDEL